MLLQREPRSNSFSNKLVSYLIDCQITNQIDCSRRTERPERGDRSVRKKLHELTEDELKQVIGRFNDRKVNSSHLFIFIVYVTETAL